MIQDSTYQHDYTVDIKQLKVINREQSSVWDTMIETYQKKIGHLKQRVNIEKTQEMQSENKQQMYQQQCLAAANSYQIDLFELRKKELKNQFESNKANLKEQIDEIKKSYEQISKNLQPLPQEQPKECSFIAGASSDYTLVLALLKKNNSRTFISLQSFYPECYISNYQDCENISVIAIKDITYRASKNQIQNKLLLANADNKTINCYMVSYDKDKLQKELIFQQELEHNIDQIHITKTLQVFVISKLGGFVYLLNKNKKKLIYQVGQVICESVYLESADILRVSNQNMIITISNLSSIQEDYEYVELKTEQFSALLYYHTNLPSRHLKYISHPQIINKQYFIYVKKNQVRVYDYIAQDKKKFNVPTQNIQIEFLNYFEKTNKLVFCDSQGQSYKVEKFTNLIG
ncbi:unnamed protein product [Paramecium octaurelia]|uniref:Uncharacterized protein n=1 Tax=Paramecium octaurelia TaxID=43137 RepID=A0A8S1S1V8_PAROT|nr:unnamed protein product [Paramecium octaurelia]